VKHFIRFAALAGAVTCAACGGGGGGSSVSPAPVAPAQSSPTPTAAPSATPLPAVPQSSAATIPFSSNQPATFTVTETGYAGPFAETDSCSPLAGTIATVHANATSATASYTVTPIARGTCTITVTDASGGGVTIPVTVSTLAVTVH
jgi:arabinan endo-1,5-alpha-L-arabinosidase